MALLVPATRRGTIQRNYPGRPADTWGTVVTASSTPHALTGTPTQLIAATTYEAEWIRLTFSNTTTAATNTDGLVNLYIGAAGSEVLFMDSLLAGWSSSMLVGDGDVRTFWFPVRIPRGTRLSAEFRALIASDTVQIMLELGVAHGEHWVGSGVETLGEDTAASEGTDVTPGTTSEGTFTAIGTSGRRYRYITLNSMGNNDTTLLAGTNAWDIGVGGAVYQGMENFLTRDHGGESNGTHDSYGFWCDIPSGTALQLRAQASGSSSGLQTPALYGCY